jgi:hypothetical protein
MHKPFKSFLFLTLTFLGLATLQLGCKKKDVYPAQQLPVIKSVSPAQGKVGTAVIIKGINFKNITSVKFGKVDAAGFSAAANTDTSVAATVPAGLEPGDNFVQVYLKDGTGYSAFKFTVLETPRVPDITSVDPVIGYPGDDVNLKGINLDVVTDVQFGNVTASFTAATDKIKTKVPANAAGGRQLIKVTSLNGTDTITFTVNLAPVIKSMSPTFGKIGDVVTVKGIRFTNATSVQLGAVATTYTVVSDSVITFPVPAGALSGSITVVTANGTGISPSAFTVDNPSFKLTIYDDALNSGWEKWGGWGTDVQDMANTEHPKTGVNSIKITWNDAYGGFQLHPQVSPLPGAYSSVKLSIYGGPGSDGKRVVLYIKDAAGTEHTKVEMVLTEGAYTTYVIPLGDLGNPPDIMEFNFQNWGTSPMTIYVDDMGLN